MIRFVRAAGSAAALFTVAVAATVAPPLQAQEGQAAPAVHYIQHAAIAAMGDDPAPASFSDSIEAPAQLSHDVDFSTQVATHAVARIEAPAAAPQPERREAAAPGRSLVQLVREHASDEVDDSEMECLAGAVYFESKGEPLAGQLAVAEVVLNRASSGRFPSTICGVVKQPSQFSFVRGGRIPPVQKGSQAWRNAVAIAQIALDDLAASPVSNAMFFHATRVSPRWRGPVRLATVGNHVFYR